MADKSRVVQLIIKKLRHNMTVQEQEELDAWTNESPENGEFMKTRMQPQQVIAGIKARLEKDDLAIRSNLKALFDKPSLRTIDPERIEKKYIKRIGLGAVIAAAVVIVLLTGINIWLVHEKKDALALLKKQLQEMVKNTDRPRISLPDGKIIFPGKTTINKTWEGAGWRVSQVDSQDLVYAALPVTKAAEKEVNQGWINLSIPYGQSWKISLPDGSRVQLNTGSALSYPVNASARLAANRALALDGEAWFEVMSNPQNPFIVATMKGVTTALGTSFNIRDYAGEKSLLVTLVTGSAKVSNGRESTMLLPRQEALIAAGIHIQVDTIANLDERLSWQSQYFKLTDMNIRQVMQQLTKWYRMDGTVFREKVDTVTPGILGGGHVAKDMTLPDLLQKLLQRADLNFRIENKKIIISQNNRVHRP